jgi:hypothetical protein
MSVVEYSNVIPPILCNDIINYFNKENSNIFLIPKNNTKWKRIEMLLYKELLLHIDKYKKTLLNQLTDIYTNQLYSSLSSKLYLDSFKIIKYSQQESDIFINNYELTNNRHNVLSFIFYLNDLSEGGEISFKNNNITVKANKCSLIIFPENIPNNYKCKLPIHTDQYIITGQIRENYI